MWQRLFCDTALTGLGGPLGALARSAIGALARGAIDTVTDALGIGRRDPTRDTAFTLGVIVLSAKMAKVDGAVSAPEIAAFREVFQVPEEALDRVGSIFDRAREDADGFRPYAEQLAGLFEDRPEVLEQVLVGLFHIGKADGPIREPELAYLTEVAEAFGIAPETFERIRAAEIGEDGRDPYAVLGIDHDADVIAVKRAYIDLVRRNHPDRLVGAGLPPEFVEQATARLAAVNIAYRAITKARSAAT